MYAVLYTYNSVACVKQSGQMQYTFKPQTREANNVT